MKVEDSSSYRLIFSISKHPYLGSVVEPYVIELTSQKTLSLTYQKLFSGNASYYSKLSQQDLALIKLLDPIMVENLIKRFSPQQRIRPKEYFHKHFDKDLFKQVIRPYMEMAIVRLLKNLDPNKHLLYRADEINPAAERIEITQEFSKVLFHFRRNEFGTKYFATIRYNDERVPFMKLGALLMSNQPAFLVVQNKLLRFYDFVEGNKLAVFLNRKYVLVKPEQEKEYFENFVKKHLERSPVYAEGINIKLAQFQASAQLHLSNHNNEFVLLLKFKYGPYVFDYHPTKNEHVHLEWLDGEAVFTKVRISKQWEKKKEFELKELGLKHQFDNVFTAEESSIQKTISWISRNKKLLEEKEFIIESDLKKKYALDSGNIHYTVSDKQDWFDLNIEITIGEFKIPFKKFLPFIKKGEDEYLLPNGHVFLIPEEWFALGEKLLFSKVDGSQFKVPKFQLDILDHIKSNTIKDHLNQIKSIKEESVSKNFKGKLRPYQLEGLSWLMFLHHNRFGGILADDMGLGKTIQTLAYLQKIKDEYKSSEESKFPSLLVAPTSLLFNWFQEVGQFTPKLKVHIHAGSSREKTAVNLNKYDLVITSYGLIRNDFALFEEMQFNVIILDESQHIKNQSAKSTQLINKLNSVHRLCLTGTPIENSIKDLWSQMNFLNKGLLKSAKQFESEYVRPIEKQQDKSKTLKLQELVKPFVLRRTKLQVAKDLPDLTEKTIFCEMSSEQKTRYEEIKSEYRNNLLQIVEEQGLEKSKLSILQGLTKLRQLASHPRLVDPDYTGDSGKHNSLLEHIKTAIEEGHRILVFSQFVSYLEILERDIVKLKIPYLKLTGSTPAAERKKNVNTFQKSNEHPIFLISLKAGGVGLNLTEADYVFIADPWWNPAAEAQARDRTHRIGQKNKVISYKFISTDTVEEKIIKMQNRKKVYATDIIQIEENVIKNLKAQDLKSLFA